MCIVHDMRSVDTSTCVAITSGYGFIVKLNEPTKMLSRGTLRNQV